MLWQDRSNPSELFFKKSALQICSIFTGEHACESMISKSYMQKNGVACRLFSSKFAAYLQNTFLEEHLRGTASDKKKRHCVSQLLLQMSV